MNQDSRAIKQYETIGRLAAKRLYPIPAGLLCCDCNHRPATDRHHVDLDTQNNENSNVLLLCRKCHLSRHRKANGVGSRSKLTSAQIRSIKRTTRPMWKTAQKIGICTSYANRIKKGAKNPKPSDTYKARVIPDWEYREMRGKKRALTVEQVKEILSFRPTLGGKRARRLANKFGVCLATIYKARGRQGCYADSIYEASKIARHLTEQKTRRARTKRKGSKP